ncbi:MULTISPECIES: FMN-binding negative transcriptional regulator [Pseudomonadati]|uniref:FMN-binding negative transcriptional regulator n=1 Tax=Shewanella aestuarii TaxID=1028752 RepID=A0ABT0KZN3_9GAMM|nr:FMN-binding negative transcriptional regulator [Shewanella aestuarii]MCL1116928.1 FMN-binding negative transcriptional regulator [Shewanella aestuarii]GGN78327.1 transcriptional regulator [Shewanella aestuarii]
MYVPEKWKMEATSDIQQFIQQHGFAMIVSSDLEASHLPLILEPNTAKQGVLYGHFARSNPHWKNIVGRSVLCVFNGPHAYISPTWYDAYPAVPTWNYITVHAKGVVELTDEATTLKMLNATISKYEPSLLEATDESEGFIPKAFEEKLAKGIVGFKIVINELQAKQKLGQHRSNADQQGVANGLANSTDLDAQQLFNYMKANNIGIG